MKQAAHLETGIFLLCRRSGSSLQWRDLLLPAATAWRWRCSSEGASPAGVVHVFWDAGMLDHDAGAGVFDTGFDPGFLEVLEKHPENPDRVRNMVSILRRGPISSYISWHPGRSAHTSELLSFHTPEYVEELVQADAEGPTKLCEGTFLNPPSRADGYCFLNNAGIASQLALDSGCRRVAVIDIDVHYGNGTAEGFYRSSRVLTISLHMNHGSWGPSHPQSGAIDELGEGEGLGYNLNIPLPNGTGDKGYAYAMSELVAPAVRKFDPGSSSSFFFWVQFDPNGRQCLTMAGYRTIGGVARELAQELAGGRLLLVQEGGYHLTYSAYCLHATLEGVLGLEEAPLLPDPVAYYPEDEAFAVEVVDAIKRQWRKTNPLFRDP
ncbi:unnamed protein product [Spirodela intermedia]|uniref:Histone deacetylase domain-containing protein n=1 Tax=Spirodela intermedia TaxID=51605 RepID=A0A7I8IRC0_SPIIN|nr:unnamed protein product [Spirodela intermedia]CAA6660503.1 unnamed protein product [Spirodela intermedia]